MKNQFTLRCMMFLPVLFLCVSVKPYYLLKDGQYQDHPKHRWVYNAIEKSQAKNTGAKLLLIGDSVGHQFFNGFHDHGEIYSLTTTGAIDIVGQYVLLSEFLKNNHPETVVIMNTGFRGNLNAPQVFHHFLKPFNKEEFQPYFTERARKRIKAIPYYFLSQVPHFLTTTWGPKIPFVPDTTNMCISPLTIEYLKKMESLTKEKGIDLVVIPPPLNKIRKKTLQKFMKPEIEEFGLEGLFRYYFDNLQFKNSKQFQDNIHLHHKFVKKYKPRYVELFSSFIEKE